MERGLVIGLGDAGINMAWSIADENHADALAVHRELVNPCLPRYAHAETLSVEVDQRGPGEGCGTPDLRPLDAHLEGRTKVTILVGLAGGTADAALPVASFAKRHCPDVSVLGLMPFGFEGKERLEAALRTVADLEAAGIKVISAENDEMVRMGRDASMREALRLMTKRLASRCA